MYTWKSQGTSEGLRGDFKVIFRAISGPIPVISRSYVSYQSRISMDVSFLLHDLALDAINCGRELSVCVEKETLSQSYRRHDIRIPKTEVSLYTYPCSA
jgi:hypothetical protein